MKVEVQDYLKMHLREKKNQRKPISKYCFVGQDDMHQAFWDGNVRLKNNKNRDNAHEFVALANLPARISGVHFCIPQVLYFTTG